ncbi:hypothetical protein KOAAANKH_02312 [Brevundimonas sp. NIBR10]|uniref:hypothetical protein n=1 Tax=Brevundimonas sp. NIBR10 TaxID=3015997 RepID=UPI0022F16E83|nr:hypothetical protein [Brevundimonas sp. NIBR10]WGM47435.1 hypothetical protein KOAAANKH_02312 [Brevundimonas sp. NIBR10]
MQGAKSEGRILCGFVEALIGGSAMAGILAVAFLISATVMPTVTQTLMQMTDRTGVVAAR